MLAMLLLLTSVVGYVIILLQLFLTVVGMYLTINLAFFEYRIKRTPRRNWINKISYFLSNGSLCFICAALLLIRNLSEQIKLRFGRQLNLVRQIYLVGNFWFK